MTNTARPVTTFDTWITPNYSDGDLYRRRGQPFPIHSHAVSPWCNCPSRTPGFSYQNIFFSTGLIRSNDPEVEQKTAPATSSIISDTILNRVALTRKGTKCGSVVWGLTGTQKLLARHSQACWNKHQPPGLAVSQPAGEAFDPKASLRQTR